MSATKRKHSLLISMFQIFSKIKTIFTCIMSEIMYLLLWMNLEIVRCLRQSSSPAFLDLHLVILKIPEVKGTLKQELTGQHLCSENWHLQWQQSQGLGWGGGGGEGVEGGWLAPVSVGAGGSTWCLFWVFYSFGIIILLTELCKEVGNNIHSSVSGHWVISPSCLLWIVLQ